MNKSRILATTGLAGLLATGLYLDEDISYACHGAAKTANTACKIALKQRRPATLEGLRQLASDLKFRECEDHTDINDLRECIVREARASATAACGEQIDLMNLDSCAVGERSTN